MDVTPFPMQENQQGISEWHARIYVGLVPGTDGEVLKIWCEQFGTWYCHFETAMVLCQKQKQSKCSAIKTMYCALTRLLSANITTRHVQCNSIRRYDCGPHYSHRLLKALYLGCCNDEYVACEHYDWFPFAYLSSCVTSEDGTATWHKMFFSSNSV